MTIAPADRPRQHQQHPVVAAQQAHRAAKAQLRIADAITAFAGSMHFVYIHAVAVRGVDAVRRSRTRGRS